MAGLVDIYLQDHEAGQVVGKELARRCLSSNRGTELGEFLEAFVAELDVDAATLHDAMHRLGVRPAPAKQAVAWTAEKAARLKLNGRLLRYSPLSRVEELEALSLAVEGKLAGWLVLRDLATRDARLARTDLDDAIRRARQQRRQLERFRRQAAHEAFVSA